MKNIVVTQDVWLTLEQENNLSKLWNVKYFNDTPKSKEEWLERVKWFDIIYSEETFMHENIYDIKECFLTFPFSWFLKTVNIDILKQNNVISSSAKWWNKYAVSERNIMALLNITRRSSLMQSKNKKIERWILSTITWTRELSVLILWEWNIWSTTWLVCKSLWMNVGYYKRWDDLKSKLKWINVIINCLISNKESEWILNKNSLSDFIWYYITCTRDEIHINEDIIEMIYNWAILGYATDCASIAWGNSLDAQYVNLKNKLEWYNAFITPHIARSTTNAIKYSNDICINNIESYINWKPINLVY